MDPAGDFVVAWGGYQDGSGFGVNAQRYNASGTTQGSQFRVNTYTTNDQSWPTVSMNSTGDFVVAWMSEGQDGSSYGIYAQRYNAAGVAQGLEFKVNTYTTQNQRLPTVAMDSNGDFVVAWVSFGQDGSLYGVYAQRYNIAGVAQGSEFKVNTYTTSDQHLPRVAMDSDGDFVIAWESVGQDGDSRGIYAQRYNAAGVAQGSEFRVNAYTTNGQERPSVAMDAVGNFVIAWESVGQDGSGYGIYAQRYNDAGVPQGSEFKVNTYTTANQRFSTLAMDSAGDFVVAWESNYQDGSLEGIYAQRYDSAGVARGSEFRVNTYTTNEQSWPTVAMDATGDFVVAWERHAFEVGIYAQRFAVVPTDTVSSFLFDTAPHRLQVAFDENVSASLGTDDLVVQNLTTSQTIPSSDFSLSYDLPTNIATFTYVGPGGSLLPGVLPDGNYRATLLAAGVATPNGNSLPADHILNFFFLNGDADHDARVNLLDFNILAANFGQSNRTFSQGDFNYDTSVNLVDFNILASRFGVSLGPVPEPKDAPTPLAPRFGEWAIQPLPHEPDDPLAALLRQESNSVGNSRDYS